MSELERLRAQAARVVALCMAAGDWVHRDQVLAAYTDEAGEVPVAALAELVGSGDQLEVHEGWDLDGPDAELAHIEALHAAEKRVLDAAEAWLNQWGPEATKLSPVYYTPQSQELFAAAFARRALTGEQKEGAARHGYTSHGWPCCGYAIVDEEPRAVAKCGGPGLCKQVCGAEVAALHGEVRADA